MERRLVIFVFFFFFLFSCHRSMARVRADRGLAAFGLRRAWGEGGTRLLPAGRASGAWRDAVSGWGAICEALQTPWTPPHSMTATVATCDLTSTTAATGEGCRLATGESGGSARVRGTRSPPPSPQRGRSPAWAGAGSPKRWAKAARPSTAGRERPRHAASKGGESRFRGSSRREMIV